MPDKSNFFSSLKDCGINQEECDRAVNVWNVFKIKTLGEYHDLYLKIDVLLLANLLIYVQSIMDYILVNVLEHLD